MFFKRTCNLVTLVILLALSAAGCKSPQAETTIPPTPTAPETIPASPMSANNLTATPAPPSPTLDLSGYAFPEQIDPEKQYLFYLHGKIIEDQGLPAISPDYGEYEYGPILEKLSDYGFVVISEQRSKNTDGVEYARKVAKQVTTLLNANVPAKNITVVGASKGGSIAIFVSYLLKNKEADFVILGDCHPDTLKDFKQSQIFLYGNVLSIYDDADQYAGSCRELLAFSEGEGASRYDETILKIGQGHGILYKPLDEWIIPTVQWARKPHATPYPGPT
jgi:hypothetical protein